jgi:hypothetical protein
MGESKPSLDRAMSEIAEIRGQMARAAFRNAGARRGCRGSARPGGGRFAAPPAATYGEGGTGAPAPRAALALRGI